MFESSSTTTTTANGGDILSSSLTTSIATIVKRNDEINDEQQRPMSATTCSQQKQEINANSMNSHWSSTSTQPMSSSTTINTSEAGYNSSDNMLSSASMSRKASTASEYTSLSSDYTPENTITPNSTFAIENRNGDNYFEINDNVELPSVGITQNKSGEPDLSTENDEQKCLSNLALKGISPISHDYCSSTGPVQNTAPVARKVSRFYVNPVVLPRTDSSSSSGIKFRHTKKK
uniref:Uncharacterized protein n=1 Tax=Glossina morsitans morsitans TaxID=37546 RepID=A0A1B0FDD4_GLOMM